MKALVPVLMTIMMLGGVAFSAVILQEDFTSGDSGTLPATLSAEWDPGTDVSVIDLATAGITVDHTGGDGYVLRLADLVDAYWNFCFPADFATVSYADSAVEAWVYFDFEGITAARRYGLFIRCTPDPTPDAGGRAVYGDRNAYWFFITMNSTLDSYTSPDYRPFLLKFVNGVLVAPVPLAEGTNDYTTGWHKLRLEAEGTVIRGYVDSTIEVVASDSTHTAGFAGMVYYNSLTNGGDKFGSFDNFLWETIEAPPPPAAVNPQLWALY